MVVADFSAKEVDPGNGLMNTCLPDDFFLFCGLVAMTARPPPMQAHLQIRARFSPLGCQLRH
jgi:hypothetical protein